jgi:hypothetical protein
MVNVIFGLFLLLSVELEMPSLDCSQSVKPLTEWIAWRTIAITITFLTHPLFSNLCR